MFDLPSLILDCCPENTIPTSSKRLSMSLGFGDLKTTWLAYTIEKEPDSSPFHFQRKNQGLMERSVNWVMVTLSDGSKEN